MFLGLITYILMYITSTVLYTYTCIHIYRLITDGLLVLGYIMFLPRAYCAQSCTKAKAIASESDTPPWICYCATAIPLPKQKQQDTL